MFIDFYSGSGVMCDLYHSVFFSEMFLGISCYFHTEENPVKATKQSAFKRPE